MKDPKILGKDVSLHSSSTPALTFHDCEQKGTLCTSPFCFVHGFSRQEYWSGLPCPPPGDLPSLGVKAVSLMSPVLAGRFFTTSTTWEALHVYMVHLRDVAGGNSFALHVDSF